MMMRRRKRRGKRLHGGVVWCGVAVVVGSRVVREGKVCGKRIVFDRGGGFAMHTRRPVPIRHSCCNSLAKSGM